MKIKFKPVSEHGKTTVMDNLRRMKKIFDKPAIRWTMNKAAKLKLPKEYRRGKINISLEEEDGCMIFQMPENPIMQGKNKSIIEEKAWNFIEQCDGRKEDFEMEVLK